MPDRNIIAKAARFVKFRSLLLRRPASALTWRGIRSKVHSRFPSNRAARYFGVSAEGPNIQIDGAYIDPSDWRYRQYLNRIEARSLSTANLRRLTVRFANIARLAWRHFVCNAKCICRWVRAHMTP
ncbi:MAG: hypothetical protein ACYC96_06315 [Fimbriimonadaceae bacterium]